MKRSAHQQQFLDLIRAIASRQAKSCLYRRIESIMNKRALVKNVSRHTGETCVTIDVILRAIGHIIEANLENGEETSLGFLRIKPVTDTTLPNRHRLHPGKAKTSLEVVISKTLRETPKEASLEPNHRKNCGD